jgi:hypothetical protein
MRGIRGWRIKTSADPQVAFVVNSYLKLCILFMVTEEILDRHPKEVSWFSAYPRGTQAER